jgi:formylglycine-generating enzyme required for sulfatase activity
LPDIDWKPVPNDGKFIYQEKQRRTEPDFWIARYPVTYAQYRAFREAEDGFRNPKWWRGLAAPKGHSDAPGKQRFPYWNHPAENVSWYDAIAFCRWLTEKVKAEVEARAEGWEKLPPPGWDPRNRLRITLPTEWQWEKAARGHDGRIFPWGGHELEDYKSGDANIDETASIVGTKVGPHYLQKTSAVGMYPQGGSPYGVLDMSGNVWEWCLNKYEKPDDRNPEEGSETRVLRGGSWYYNVELAAASWRSRDGPNIRYSGCGFRVVAVSSSPLALRSDVLTSGL